MKKLLMALSLIGILTSCNNSDDFNQSVTSEEPQPQEVTIHLTTYDMESMAVAHTRAASALNSDIAKFLDIWIINGTDTIKANQKVTDENFGNLTVTLNKNKVYTMYAIAHNATDQATLKDNIITFPENNPRNTFFYKNTFTPANVENINGVMQRIVGMFRLETADVVPDECTQMRFTIMNVGVGFNVTNGNSENPTNFVKLFPSFTKGNLGTAAFTVTMLPDDQESQSTFTIKVEAMDANDNVIQERIFTDVPIKANYKTSYKGDFFTDGQMSGTFSCNIEWNEYDETSF